MRCGTAGSSPAWNLTTLDTTPTVDHSHKGVKNIFQAAHTGYDARTNFLLGEVNRRHAKFEDMTGNYQEQINRHWRKQNKSTPTSGYSTASPDGLHFGVEDVYAFVRREKLRKEINKISPAKGTADTDIHSWGEWNVLLNSRNHAGAEQLQSNDQQQCQAQIRALRQKKNTRPPPKPLLPPWALDEAENKNTHTLRRVFLSQQITTDCESDDKKSRPPKSLLAKPKPSTKESSVWARGVQTKPEIPTNKDKKRNSRVCRPGAPSSSNSSWAHGETKLFPLSHYEKSLGERRHANKVQFWKNMVLPTIKQLLGTSPLCLLERQSTISTKKLRRLLARRSIDVSIHELQEIFSPINRNFTWELKLKDILEYQMNC